MLKKTKNKHSSIYNCFLFIEIFPELSKQTLYLQGRLWLDRSTARYIYKAKNGKLLVVLTPSQKAKLIFEQYIQTLFNKDLFKTIIYWYIEDFRKIAILFSKKLF
jgi:hypothetical protein